jgi:hypothetical protein
MNPCAADGQQSQSSSISQSTVRLHRVAAFCFARSWLFELAVSDHVANIIVNANHGII